MKRFKSAWLVFILCIAIPHIMLSASADSVFASLKNLPVTTQIDSLMTLGRMNLRANQRLAAALLMEAEKKSLSVKDSLKAAACMAMRAFTIPQEFPDSTIVLYEAALPVLAKNKHKFEAIVLANLATLYEDKNDFETAIKYNQRAAFLAVAAGNAYAHSMTLGNIASLYESMRKYDIAEEYITKAESVAKAGADSLSLGIAYERHSVILNHGSDSTANIDSSIVYKERSIAILSKLGREDLLAKTYGNLGNLYILKNDFVKAKQFLEMAVLQNEPRENYVSLSMNYSNLGYVELQYGRFAEAITWARKGLNAAEKSQLLRGKVKALEVLSKSYLKLNKPDSASYYYDLFFQSKSEWINEYTHAQLTELEAKYQAQERELQIAQLNEENAVSKMKIEESRVRLISLSAIVVVVFILLVLSFVIYRNKKQKQIQEAEIEFNKKLIDGEIQSREEERQRVAKELHDGIAQSMVSLKMQMQFDELQQSKEGLDQAGNLESYIEKLGNISDEVRAISHDMMPVALIQSGLAEALKQLSENVFPLRDISFEYDCNRYAQMGQSKSVEIALYRIAQELLNNIVKHSGAKNVSINLYSEANAVILEVQDDGVGIAEDKQETGIGMFNIKARVKSFNGNFNIDRQAVGTRAVVRLSV